MINFYPHKTEPPFTLIVAPVIQFASSDARKRIGPAISFGSGILPSGIVLLTCSTKFGSLKTSAHISVFTHPGATQFTRILYLASSTASDFVNAIIAPFEAA